MSWKVYLEDENVHYSYEIKKHKFNRQKGIVSGPQNKPVSGNKTKAEN